MRDERRRLRIATEEIDDKEKALKLMSRADWIPDKVIDYAANGCSDKHIQINIGGLMFEAPKEILTRDAGSVLAQLCSDKPPIERDRDGFFFFQRDW